MADVVLITEEEEEDFSDLPGLDPLPPPAPSITTKKKSGAPAVPPAKKKPTPKPPPVLPPDYNPTLDVSKIERPTGMSDAEVRFLVQTGSIPAERVTALRSYPRPSMEKLFMQCVTHCLYSATSADTDEPAAPINNPFAGLRASIKHLANDPLLMACFHTATIGRPPYLPFATVELMCGPDADLTPEQVQLYHKYGKTDEQIQRVRDHLHLEHMAGEMYMDILAHHTIFETMELPLLECEAPPDERLLPGQSRATMIVTALGLELPPRGANAVLQTLLPIVVAAGLYALQKHHKLGLPAKETVPPTKTDKQQAEKYAVLEWYYSDQLQSFYMRLAPSHTLRLKRDARLVEEVRDPAKPFGDRPSLPPKPPAKKPQGKSPVILRPGQVSVQQEDISFEEKTAGSEDSLVAMSQC